MCSLIRACHFPLPLHGLTHCICLVFWFSILLHIFTDNSSSYNPIPFRICWFQWFSSSLQIFDFPSYGKLLGDWPSQKYTSEGNSKHWGTKTHKRDIITSDSFFSSFSYYEICCRSTQLSNKTWYVLLGDRGRMVLCCHQAMCKFLMMKAMSGKLMRVCWLLNTRLLQGPMETCEFYSPWSIWIFLLLYGDY